MFHKHEMLGRQKINKNIIKNFTGKKLYYVVNLLINVKYLGSFS